MKENQVFLKSESIVKKTTTTTRKPYDKPVWGSPQDEPSVTIKPKETIDLLHKPNRPSWVDVQETTTSHSTLKVAKIAPRKTTTAAFTVTRPTRKRTTKRTTTPRAVFGLGGASVTLQDLGGGNRAVTRTGSSTAQPPAVTTSAKPTVEPGRVWGQRGSDRETESVGTRDNNRGAPRRARDESDPPVWG